MSPYRDDVESGLPDSRSNSPSPERSFSEDDALPTYSQDEGERIYKSAITRWLSGPIPPQHLYIKPIFPNLQATPLRIFDRVCPSKQSKLTAWVIACLTWLIAFILIAHNSSFQGAKARILGCGDSLWLKNNGCGLNGIDCRLFANETFAFRCPSSCGSVQLLEPYTVGSQELNYQPLVIGGGLPSGGVDPQVRHYRADSFICIAAVHAGVHKANKGGCAKLRKTGMQPSFPASTSNGISSIPFDAPFASSFSIDVLEESCNDLRWYAFSITLIFNIIISLFTTSPMVFFYSLFCSIFWEIAMASDPPHVANPYSLVSIAVSRFLPTAFTAVVLEKYVIRRTLKDLTAQVEKTVLWVGACWLGALNNYTFDTWIPISRLTPHDLNQQPGAKLALVIIVVALVSIALSQAWDIRKEGHLIRYLALYIGMGATLGILTAIPYLHLRIHHYILSLLLLPGTRLQTRKSLLYQGLLVGLFINGLAKWGWDGLLQTGFELRGDALLGSSMPKVAVTAVTSMNVSMALKKFETPYNGISALINDIEVYRGSDSFISFDRRTMGEVMRQVYYDNPRDNNTASWDENDGSGTKDGRVGSKVPEKMYIRLAYMEGNEVYDYTKAGILYPNGTLVDLLN